MIPIKNLVIASLGFLTLSMGGSGQSALLTSDFGILTRDDLEITLRESHGDCQDFGWHCPEYWACLPIESFFLNCELTDNEEQAFAPGIKVQAGGSLIEFYTRRPNSIEDCKKILDEWFTLINEEKTACFFADYRPEKGIAPYQQPKYYLQLDRIKSLKGKWSYFEDLKWMPN